MFSALRGALLRSFPLLRCKGREFILNCQIIAVCLTIINKYDVGFERMVLLMWLVNQDIGCRGASGGRDWERFVRKKC